MFIHSTFISVDRFNDLLPDIKKALSQGVKVDILWGQNEISESARSTHRAVKELKARIEEEEIENLVIHPFSTKSHCKLVIYDDGEIGNFRAIVGSCNWFYSNFSSFEASIRLRDHILVADIVDQLAELSKGIRGHWTSLTNELAAISTDLRSQPNQTSSRARASIVIGPQHVDHVRTARDEASRRIFVTSHRYGTAGKAQILSPALAAAKARGVATRIYFGTTSGKFSGNQAATSIMDASKVGVQIQAVHKPRLHAKLFAWDDDCILVTSQNWLSADPPDDDLCQEIGVFVKVKGIAKYLIEQIELSVNV